jgi:hypothetical protein
MITLTTDVPCELKLTEIVIGDPVGFDPRQSHNEDATEPLSLRAAQTYDFDRPWTPTTPDETFGVFAVKATPHPGGKTTHQISTDPAVTRTVFERPGDASSRSTTPPLINAGQTLYIWVSDGTRFPCGRPDCS